MVLCEGVGILDRATFCEVSSNIVVDVFSGTITVKWILAAGIAEEQVCCVVNVNSSRRAERVHE